MVAACAGRPGAAPAVPRALADLDADGARLGLGLLRQHHRQHHADRQPRLADRDQRREDERRPEQQPDADRPVQPHEPQVARVVLQQRRQWAQESGLNPDIVEKLYRDLVNYFIDEELKDWKS